MIAVTEAAPKIRPRPNSVDRAKAQERWLEVLVECITIRHAQSARELERQTLKAVHRAVALAPFHRVYRKPSTFRLE